MIVELWRIGNFTIYAHGIVSALAALLAFGMAHVLTAGTPYRAHLTNMLPYLFVGAVAGARIWHVFFFQWGYYSIHMTEIPAIWNGGMSILGALVGGFLAMAVYSRRHRLPFRELADVTAPAVVLGQSIGRIGCYLNGDAFGSPTGLGFGMVYREGTAAYATYGAVPLWPAELFESQWTLIVFTLLMLLRSRLQTAGMLFLIYMVLYAAGRFGLEFLRGDSPRYAFDWTAGQWTACGMIAASLCLMFYIRRFGRTATPAAS